MALIQFKKLTIIQIVKFKIILNIKQTKFI